MDSVRFFANGAPLLARRRRMFALVWLVLASSAANHQLVASQQQQQPDGFAAQEQPVEPPIESYPYYMQSPLAAQLAENQSNLVYATKRANMPLPPSGARSAAPAVVPASPQAAQIAAPQAQPPNAQRTDANYQYAPKSQQPPQPQPQQQPPPQTPGCLYDKRYFLKLDQCLERKPYPTVGLAAFKNEDLMIKKGLSDKSGCSFLLTNGLFKHYQISKYSLDSDTQCLDQDQTSQLSLQFNNVSLYYLWQLRCLNYANQLLDDSTLDGKTLSNGVYPGGQSRAGDRAGSLGDSICVGSSQSFGFAALQLAAIEAQVELSIDIYKNWRVTNVTVAMLSPSPKLTNDHHQSGDYHNEHHSQQAHADKQTTSIREFTFDTIDGDELNWRYAHLYENWTRNRLHVNFLDQFKRFIWVSLQRCLSESSARLPIKINDLFGSNKYN